MIVNYVVSESMFWKSVGMQIHLMCNITEGSCPL